MNNTRRKKVLTAINSIDEIAEQIEDIKNEEEEAYDNLPESFQYSDRGYAMEDAISTLEQIQETIDEFKSELIELYEEL